MRLLARSFLVGLTLVGVSAIFMGACSNQAEGDRCDTQNGNDDCQDGLVCEPGKNICCPQDPATATEPACQAPSTAGGEAGIPVEASPGTDSSVNDSATDAPADTGSFDATDDATDANDDGG